MRLIQKLVSLATICCLVCHSVSATDATGAAEQKQAAGSHPRSLTGLWRPEVRTALFNVEPMSANEDPETRTPPLKGEYLERFNRAAERLRQIKSGAQADSSGAAFQPKIHCPPPSMPQMMLGGLEIIVTDSVVYVLNGGAARLIFTDGQGHPPIYADESVPPRPEEHLPNYLGNSVGHWEGGTLVVDTIGLKENRIDGEKAAARAEHSDALHISERLRLVTPDVLENQITLEDPKALSRPWRSTVRYHRIPISEASGEPPVCKPDAPQF